MAPDPAVPASALAIYAHPDDPEVACAATLAGWAAAGTEVTIVSVARGDKGGPAPDARLASRREEEARAAAAIVGARDWETLGHGDGEIANSMELRADLVARIRAVRPEVVLTSDPTAVFFGDRYVNHRDHREVGWAVLDAVAPAAATGSYFPDAGAAHAVRELWLSGTLEPNWWVDVAATIDAKVEALACHRSQLVDTRALGEDDLSGDVELVAEVVRHRAEVDGRAAGLRYAESYRRLLLG